MENSSMFASQGTFSKKWWLTHLLLPVLSFFVLNYWLSHAGGNELIADMWYALEGGRWSLNNHPITSFWIHKVGKNFSVFLAVVVVAFYATTFFVTKLISYRRPTLYLILSVAMIHLVVQILKSTTNIDCPWDIIRYGGTHEHLGFFDVRPASYKQGQCFPAGHASAGYVWVSLYFFCLAAKVKQPKWGLIVGLLMGLIFGIGQQLRGAHFASHDLWTLMICWMVSLAFFTLQAKHSSSAQSRAT